MIKKILLILFFSLNANAALEVTIAQGKVEPTPIAITQIFGAKRGVKTKFFPSVKN